MVYPKQTPEHRMRYPYTVKFNADQDRLLRTVLLVGEVSFSQVLERALALYIPAVFGVAWPSFARFNRPSTRLGRRATVRGLSVYGINFKREQDEVLRQLMTNNGVNFSQIAEGALAMYIPLAYHREWPHMERERPAV